MHAFVAGDVEEVRTLATDLLKAADAAEKMEGGSETEIIYKDGKINIIYPMYKK